MTRLAPLLLLVACSEYKVERPDPPPPADPPGIDPDADFGKPPDWADCAAGYYAQYYNLTADDPIVEPPDDEVAPADPTALDWWDPSRLAYRDFDGTLDIGANWWPVDEGYDQDPAYFTVRWTAWMRVWSGGTMTFTLGSASDGWVLLDGDVIGAQPGVHPFEPETIAVDVRAGQYPFDVRAAHRGGSDSAFRFRVLTGDVTICYPDFTQDEE